MAPSGKKGRRPAKNLNTKQLEGDHPVKKKKMDDECTTPKAEKYKIPENLTCPRPPKKRRVVSSCMTPVTFFNPPDIELFFASHMAMMYQLYTHA
ncbi:hypothetical protein R6Q59_008555 [Mikania micrantha]